MLRALRSLLAYLDGKGFFDLLVAKGLIHFLGFGTVLLVAKFVTPTELGEIKILQSYFSIFVIIASFGFDTAVLKVCSERSSMAEKDAVLRLSLKRALVTSFLTYGLLVVLALAGVITSTPYMAKWLVIYSVSIPIMVVTQLLLVFLQAQKRIKLMARMQAVIKIQCAIAIAVSTWKWGFDGFIFATVAAFAIGLVPLVWQVRLRPASIPQENVTKRLSGYAVFSMLANLANQIGQRGDILILDRFIVDREVIGYYSLATIFVVAATQVNGAVQQIVIPYFSENAGNKTWVVARLRENVLRMIGLSVCVAAVVYGCGWVVVHVFFAPQYREMLTYLPVLLLRYLVWSCYSLIGACLVGLGHMRFNFGVVAVATPAAMVLFYLGQRYFGVMGVAWSTVLAASMTAILSFLSFKAVLRRHY